VTAPIEKIERRVKREKGLKRNMIERRATREECGSRIEETLTQVHQSSTSHQVQYPSTSMVPQSLFS
jgi:hypothetical protein